MSERDAKPAENAETLPSQLPRADEREPRIAQVRVAIELSAEERRAIRVGLARYFGRPLDLDVVYDATVLGGVWARVGDIVLDGSVRGRLETLRHHLRSQCRVMIATGLYLDRPQGQEAGEP